MVARCDAGEAQLVGDDHRGWRRGVGHGAKLTWGRMGRAFRLSNNLDALAR